MLGSIHFVDDFAFDHKAEHWTGMETDQIYRRYFEDSISLAKSRIFDGIGHPDAIKLFGHKPSYSLTEYYESLAKELAKSNMYADQNSGVAICFKSGVFLNLKARQTTSSLLKKVGRKYGT